jgi:hypothetical protein
MTKRQRAALKLAMVIVGERERALANQTSQKSRKQYVEVVDALRVLEEWLRGEQGVMDI